MPVLNGLWTISKVVGLALVGALLGNLVVGALAGVVAGVLGASAVPLSWLGVVGTIGGASLAVGVVTQ